MRGFEKYFSAFGLFSIVLMLLVGNPSQAIDTSDENFSLGSLERKLEEHRLSSGLEPELPPFRANYQSGMNLEFESPRASSNWELKSSKATLKRSSWVLERKEEIQGRLEQLDRLNQVERLERLLQERPERQRIKDESEKKQAVLHQTRTSKTYSDKSTIAPAVEQLELSTIPLTKYYGRRTVTNSQLELLNKLILVNTVGKSTSANLGKQFGPSKVAPSAFGWIG